MRNRHEGRRALRAIVIVFIAFFLPITALAQESGSRLWILSIGVSDYTETSLDMAYPAREAAAVAGAFAGVGATHFSQIEVVPLGFGAGSGIVSRDDVVNALETIAARSAAEDTFVLFYSGRGTTVADSTFLISSRVTDTADVHQLRTRGVSWVELLQRVDRLPARHRVLLLSVHGPVDESAVVGNTFREAQVLIANAIPSLFDNAHTSPLGVALVDGLNGGAWTGNGTVTLTSLVNYVQSVVPGMTDAVGHGVFPGSVRSGREILLGRTGPSVE